MPTLAAVATNGQSLLQFNRGKRSKPETTFSGTYIVEQVGPALHGDTLEDGENSKQDVVELGDAIVWSLPVFSTRGAIWTQP